MAAPSLGHFIKHILGVCRGQVLGFLWQILGLRGSIYPPCPCVDPSLLRRGASSATFDPTRVTQLSWRPRAFLYKGFLSEEECDHLIEIAKDKLEKSMVADNESGKSIDSEVRTSSGIFLQKAQDEVVANIEARIAAWTFLPIENGESIQILHYEHGQKYEPHFDYFHDKANQGLGGHRVATVLMYLSNVEKGGETIFPKAQMSQSKDEDASDCAKQGYSVKPYKGDALLFFSLHPDATTDPSSLHGSCPVIEGEKWSATKWIHVRSFEKSIKHAVSGDCVDENDNCPLWAKAGECEKNLHIWWVRRVFLGFVGRVAICVHPKEVNICNYLASWVYTEGLMLSCI